MLQMRHAGHFQEEWSDACQLRLLWSEILSCATSMSLPLVSSDFRLPIDLADCYTPPCFRTGPCVQEDFVDVHQGSEEKQGYFSNHTLHGGSRRPVRSTWNICWWGFALHWQPSGTYCSIWRLLYPYHYQVSNSQFYGLLSQNEFMEYFVSNLLSPPLRQS